MAYTPEQKVVELLRQGLHVPAALRELVAERQGMTQTQYQRKLAAEAKRGL